MLTEELSLSFSTNKTLIIEQLTKQKANQGGFSLTLDAWTAINQDAYLGITM